MLLSAPLVELVNSPAGRSQAFDDVVFLLSSLDIFKAVVAVAVLLGVAHRANGGLLDERLTLARAAVGILGGTFLVRVSQEILPFRARPIAALEGITAVDALDEPSLEALVTSSSFPSDHASLMLGICAAVWWVSRRAGAWLTGYTLVLVLLPRVYLGYHYVSDVVVGGLVGVGITVACLAAPVPGRLARPVDAAVRRHPSVAVAVGFVVAQQTATLFNDARTVLSFFGL